MINTILAEYAERLRDQGAIRGAAVARAFATVPRHRFLRHIAVSRLGPVDVPVDDPLPDELAALIYRDDDALVTRLSDGVPTSSSSQPSLMARMLDALELAPGQRVLEIGVGTGYNAALIATITGAPVVSVDVQPDVVAEACAALQRAGYPQVTPLVADGYEGHAAGGPYDRIIVTCAVGGLSPRWFEQLAPDGRVVAPVYHGGYHPTIAAWRAPDETPNGDTSNGHAPNGGPGIVGQALIGSDFMIAAGRLHPGYARPPTLKLQAEPTVHPYPLGELDWPTYLDLWFAIAADEPRVSRRPVVEHEALGQCGLADGSELVLIQRDAVRGFGAGAALVGRARSLVARWHAAGAPEMDRWSCAFVPRDGLLRPVRWHSVAG